MNLVKANPGFDSRSLRMRALALGGSLSSSGGFPPPEKPEAPEKDSPSFDGFGNHDAVENSGGAQIPSLSRFPTVISGLQVYSAKISSVETQGTRPAAFGTDL